MRPVAKRMLKGAGMGALLAALILGASAVGGWFTWQHMHARTARVVPAAIQQFSATVASLGWAHEADVVSTAMAQPGLEVDVMFSAKGDERQVHIERYRQPEQATAQAQRLQRIPAGQGDRAAGVYVLSLRNWASGDPMVPRLQASFEAWAREAPH